MEDAEAAAETAPVSRETSLRETALPEKNSPAVREGSIEGAGGKMSDWNESDFCGHAQSQLSSREGKGRESLLCVGR